MSPPGRPKGEYRSAQHEGILVNATPTAGAAPWPSQPLVGIGSVRHARLRPIARRFAYPTWYVLLPMRALRAAPSTALPRNRFGLVSFHDRDHGDGRADSLAWLDALLAAEGVTGTDGEVWLHCMPRVLGFAFKPVSFWYCHRADGALAAIVVEVNNTFGERHCYLLDGPDVAWGRELRAAKAFHVSPFCRVEGGYRFRFLRTAGGSTGGAGRTLARIDHHDGAGALLQTSVSGDLAPLTARMLRAAFLTAPWMTLGVVLRIHWQALRLWAGRVPFVRKPAPPQRFTTR